MNDNKFVLPEDGGLIELQALRDIVCRYEKIKTHIFADASLGVAYVADKIVRAIKEYESSYHQQDEWCMESSVPFVLGLTTGRTPLELYRELVRRYEAGEVSFDRVAVCSLDEFLPLDADNPHSRNYAIRKEFLEKIDIRPENIYIYPVIFDPLKLSVASLEESRTRSATFRNIMLFAIGKLI